MIGLTVVLWSTMCLADLSKDISANPPIVNQTHSYNEESKETYETTPVDYFEDVTSASNICQAGWSDFGDPGKCYMFVEKVLNWSSALSNCQQHSASLLEPTTTERETIMAFLTLNLYLPKDGIIWLGAKLDEDGVIRWLSGREINRPRYYRKGPICGCLNKLGIRVLSCDYALPSACVTPPAHPLILTETGYYGGTRKLHNVSVSTEKPTTRGPAYTRVDSNGLHTYVIILLGVAVVMLLSGLLACLIHKLRQKHKTKAIPEGNVNHIYEYIDDDAVYSSTECKPQAKKEVDNSDTEMRQSQLNRNKDFFREVTNNKGQCVTRYHIPCNDVYITPVDIEKSHACSEINDAYVETDRHVPSSTTKTLAELTDASVSCMDMAQSPASRGVYQIKDTHVSYIDMTMTTTALIHKGCVQETDRDVHALKTEHVPELNDVTVSSEEMTETWIHDCSGELENVYVNDNSYRYLNQFEAMGLSCNAEFHKYEELTTSRENSEVVLNKL